MKQVLKSGAAVLAAATLVLTAGGAALAETARVDDRTGDVWRIPGGDDEEWEPAGSPKNADVDSTVYRHADRKLIIKTTYRRLVKEDNFFGDHVLIRTGAGDEYYADVEAGPGQWAGTFTFTADDGQQSARLRPRRGLDSCEDKEHHISYRRDVVTMTIPRSCLDRAARVKAKSVTVAGPDSEQWFDNASNATHNLKGFTRLLSAG